MRPTTRTDTVAPPNCSSGDLLVPVQLDHPGALRFGRRASVDYGPRLGSGRMAVDPSGITATPGTPNQPGASPPGPEQPASVRDHEAVPPAVDGATPTARHGGRSRPGVETRTGTRRRAPAERQRGRTPVPIPLEKHGPERGVRGRRRVAVRAHNDVQYNAPNADRRASTEPPGTQPGERETRRRNAAREVRRQQLPGLPIPSLRVVLKRQVARSSEACSPGFIPRSLGEIPADGDAVSRPTRTSSPCCRRPPFGRLPDASGFSGRRRLPFSKEQLVSTNGLCPRLLQLLVQIVTMLGQVLYLADEALAVLVHNGQLRRQVLDGLLQHRDPVVTFSPQALDRLL